MRCKRTGRALPAIWTHPGLDGQWVSAYTRRDARGLIMKITGKDLPEDDFSRTGDFAWRQRVISEPETLFQMIVQPEDMKQD